MPDEETCPCVLMTVKADNTMVNHEVFIELVFIELNEKSEMANAPEKLPIERQFHSTRLRNPTAVCPKPLARLLSCNPFPPMRPSQQLAHQTDYESPFTPPQELSQRINCYVAAYFFHETDDPLPSPKTNG
jgi:hypothetical protein